MDKPLLYRKRIIPEEIILLDKDEILYSDDSHIITRWNTIKPKKILHHGSSCYFLKEGFKVSKFYREDGTAPTIPCCSHPEYRAVPAQLERYRSLMTDAKNSADEIL